MDWRTAPQSEKRHLYYCSPEWGALREAVMKRCGGKCERCHNVDADQVHHLTYKRLYKEKLEDLQALCHPCHLFKHGKLTEDPAYDSAPLPEQKPALQVVEKTKAEIEVLRHFKPEDFCGYGFAILCCPKCGFDYTHVNRVYTEQGIDPNEGQGAYAGTTVDGRTSFRRAALVIEFDCEAGCRFRMIIQQHKGNNFIRMEPISDSNETAIERQPYTMPLKPKGKTA